MSFLYEKRISEELNWQLNLTFLNNYKVNEEQTEAIDYIQKRVIH